MEKEKNPYFIDDKLGCRFAKPENIFMAPTDNHSFISVTEQNHITAFITSVCACITREPYTVKQRLNVLAISESGVPLLLFTTNLMHIVTKASYSWSHLLTDFNKPLAHLQLATFSGYRFYFKCDGLVYAVTIGDCPEKESIDATKLHNHYPDTLERLTFALRDVAIHYVENRDKFYQSPLANVKIEIV